MQKMSYSSLAKKVPNVRDPNKASFRMPWGFLIHTCGGGVTDYAKKHNKKPIDVAIKIYIDSQNGSNGYFWGGPHYVCDHDGTLYQIAPEEAKTAHAGSQNRQYYLDGSWVSKCSSSTVSEWKKRWPGQKHPYSMFPNTSPNTDYVGLEMIPIGDGFGGAPLSPGLRFTKAQHDAAIALAKDVGVRQNWPAGWSKGGRLLGHEDVDPIERSDKGGGWDPGYLRVAPYFDFKYVRDRV